MNNWRDNIDFVLVEPTESGNIGSTSRAMGAMGFYNLSLVNPPKEMSNEAYAFAHNAVDVLTSAKSYYKFKDSLKEASLVIGISRRTGKGRGMNLSMDEAIQKITEVAQNDKVAILFGRESRGLFNHETEECAYLLAIPAGGEHPSLNLSHAVQIVAYELHKASLELNFDAEEDSPSEKEGQLSTYGAQEHLFGRVIEILEELNYTKQGDREIGKRIRVSLKHFFRRAGLTISETQMFEGICSRILAFIRKD
jgi:TrmH family RNA methyltransferase